MDEYGFVKVDLEKKNMNNSSEIEKVVDKKCDDEFKKERFDNFLELYKKLSLFYETEINLNKNTIPSIHDLRNMYKDVKVTDEAIRERRNIVQKELTLLDLALRDTVVMRKYGSSTENQRFLIEAVDYYTKKEMNAQWTNPLYKFVVCFKNDTDKYDMGNQAIFNDETFFFKFLKDYNFAELYLEKIKEADLKHTLLSPLHADSFLY